eukprot:8208301-Pyramimonas_sp.AAC.1
MGRGEPITEKKDRQETSSSETMRCFQFSQGSDCFCLCPPPPAPTPRDLMRVLSKSSKMPNVYQAEGVFWDKRSSTKYKAPFNFLLPYEILEVLIPEGDEERWATFPEGTLAAERSLKNLCERIGARRFDNDSAAPLGGFGVWGDAAPYKHRDSLYLTSMEYVHGASDTPQIL